jgi:hypothetical protein
LPNFFPEEVLTLLHLVSSSLLVEHITGVIWSLKFLAYKMGVVCASSVLLLLLWQILPHHLEIVCWSCQSVTPLRSDESCPIHLYIPVPSSLFEWVGEERKLVTWQRIFQEMVQGILFH